jgi:hypothetical protein
MKARTEGVGIMDSIKTNNNGHFYDLFLIELHSRIGFLPIESSIGNNCISIDMTNCSDHFLTLAEIFIADNSEFFKLAVKGQVYYLEVLKFPTFVDAYSNKFLKENSFINMFSGHHDSRFEIA